MNEEELAVYALIKLDARKINESKTTVDEISKRISELGNYAEISHFSSLESLALEKGFKNEKAIPLEVEPIVTYINKLVESSTKNLLLELKKYKDFIEEFKLKTEGLGDNS